MKLFVMALCALLPLTQQALSSDECACELVTSQEAFPHDRLSSAEVNALQCNSNVPMGKIGDLERLLAGLERWLPLLQADVSVLEREDDGELYGAISLQVIENRLMEVNQLMAKFNSTILGNQHLTTSAAKQLKDLEKEMQELEAFDSMKVVTTQQTNQRLKRDLEQCKNGLEDNIEPTPGGNSRRGQLLNVTGPRVRTAGEYPGSYAYGAWGRDPKPGAGKEGWYWLVILTLSNVFAHYVRYYTSLSALIVGQSTPGNVMIHSANPTTNTIQGPNVVLYGEALYYNCYNEPAVCRFNITTKTVTKVQLPKDTRFNSKGNFCHIGACYPYTDLDLATDESGVWVIYSTTEYFGNMLLAKVEEGEPPRLNQTWQTSVYKQAVTNTFMARGVLYATRFISKDVEEIFYSLDTATGQERFKIGIFIKKVSTNIFSLNYSPIDHMLHAYCDSKMASYKVLFG